MARAPSLRRSGTLLAAAMLVANLLGYALVLVLTRALAPDDFGAVAALLSLSLIGIVPALALQLVAARETAKAAEDVTDRRRGETGGPEDRTELGELGDRMMRLGVLVGATQALAVLVLSPLVSAFLHLGSVWQAVVLAASLLPGTVVFAGQGVLQGAERFGGMSVLFVITSAARTIGGTVPAVTGGGPGAVMSGIAVGALVAAGVAWHLTGRPGMLPPHPSRERLLVGQVLAATVSTSGLLVLINVDVPLARNVLSPWASGAYAVGAIFAKGAFWGPQFLATLLYPRMAQHASRRQAVAGAVGLTAAVGVAVVLVTAGLAAVLVPLVAGQEYADLAPIAWRFAALGATLAVVQVLVYARLAVSDRRLGAMAWGVAVVVCAVVLSLPDPSVADVVSTVLVGAVVLAATGLVTQWAALRRAPQALDAA